MQKKRLVIFIVSFIVFFLLFSTKSLATEDMDVTNQFQDENLRNAILEIVRKVEGNTEKETILLSDIETITANDLPSGKQLNLAGKDIKNLTGLELFADKGIEWIYLDWNQISDISILSKFASLTKISASGNQISNLTPISNLTNLQNINFGNNQIQNIEPITKLTNLKYLYLDNNQISDINEIQNLSRLRELSIAGNKIQNVDGLFSITTLENVDISRNQITNLSNIMPNTNLSKLNINYNQLTSLLGIEKLISLEVLSASNNQIQDITTISGLIKLYNLNLNKNEIADITSLASCIELQYLYLDNNHIIDVSAIETLGKLKKVTVYNQIAYVILTEEYNTEQVKINLTSLFRNLKDSNSKIYAENITCKMDNNITYTISDQIDYIIVNVSDVKKEDLIFRMEDQANTYITLMITMQKQEEKPTVENEIANTVTNTVEDEETEEGKPNNSDNSISIYPIEEGYIKNIVVGTTSEQCVKNTGLGKAYITRNNQILKDTDIVKNGDTLKTDTKSYTLIVRGDPSGDGRLNITDLMKVKRAIIGSIKLNTIETLAADLNGDSKISIMDVMNFIKEITK